LWGLIAKGLIPSSPSEDQLRAFYQRFRSTDKIESAITGGSNLVAFEAIETLKKARANCIKVGQNMLHMSDFNTRYIYSLLSRLGLTS
jgi:hypothetical protein